MKRSQVLLLCLLFFILNSPAAVAQDDMCTPDAVVASFSASLKDLESWLQAYSRSNCSTQIRNGARMFAAAYQAMGAQYIPFSVPGDPGVLNPILNWQPGASNVNVYDLTMEPGALTMIAGAGTTYWDAVQPMIVYTFEGDFVAHVKVVFSPTPGGFKGAGIGVRSSENNNIWLRVTRQTGDKGQVVRADGRQGQELYRDAFTMNFVSYAGDTVYLKIERRGPLFTLSYSENEISWTALQQDYVFQLPSKVEIFLVTISDGTREGVVARFSNFSVASR